MNGRRHILTYIIKTIDDEFYCGKTFDIDKRMEEHKKEKAPKWFGFKNRKEFTIIYKKEGDYEKDIKRFGVEKFVGCLRP